MVETYYSLAELEKALQSGFKDERDKIHQVHEAAKQADLYYMYDSAYYQGRKLGTEQEISKLYERKESESVSFSIPDYSNKVTDTQLEPKKAQGFNQLMDELQDNIERCTRNNLFIVNFLDMPYDMIKSVESFDNEISLQLYDFVYDDGTPVIKQLYEIMRKGDFDIEIQRLNNLGEPIYIEKYRDCCINNISRSRLDYSSDELSTISLNIIFKDLTFRKPGIPKRKRTKISNYEGCITQKD